MASRKGGIGLGTLALLFILVYFAWTTGALASLGFLGGNGGVANGIVLDAPINISLLKYLVDIQPINELINLDEINDAAGNIPECRSDHPADDEHDERAKETRKECGRAHPETLE